MGLNWNFKQPIDPVSKFIVEKQLKLGLTRRMKCTSYLSLLTGNLSGVADYQHNKRLFGYPITRSMVMQSSEVLEDVTATLVTIKSIANDVEDPVINDAISLSIGELINYITSYQYEAEQRITHNSEQRERGYYE